MIKDQTNEYYDLYDNLANHVSDEDQISILNANKQFVPDNKIEVSVL